MSVDDLLTSGVKQFEFVGCAPMRTIPADLAPFESRRGL